MEKGEKLQTTASADDGSFNLAAIYERSINGNLALVSVLSVIGGKLVKSQVVRRKTLLQPRYRPAPIDNYE